MYPRCRSRPLAHRSSRPLRDRPSRSCGVNHSGMRPRCRHISQYYRNHRRQRDTSCPLWRVHRRDTSCSRHRRARLCRRHRPTRDRRSRSCAPHRSGSSPSCRRRLRPRRNRLQMRGIPCLQRRVHHLDTRRWFRRRPPPYRRRPQPHDTRCQPLAGLGRRTLDDPWSSRCDRPRRGCPCRMAHRARRLRTRRFRRTRHRRRARLVDASRRARTSSSRPLRSSNDRHRTHPMCTACRTHRRPNTGCSRAPNRSSSSRGMHLDSGS
jgi:hypothetical protein